MLSSVHQTPSQGLNLAFRGFQLDSQPERPSCSQQQYAVSQISQDPAFGSQDFITPVDQQTQAEPADSHAPPLRTPAILSPTRAKRPRRSAPAMVDTSWSQSDMDVSQSMASQAEPQWAPPAPLRQKVRRVMSPQRFTNVFLDPSTPEPDKSAAFRPLPVADIYSKLFKEVSVLGQGCFSRVTRVQHRLDGTEYAIKRSMRPISTDAELRQWCQEIQALAAAGTHPGIARYHGAWLEQRSGGEYSVFIQMEMCGMTLGSRLAIQGHPFREAELLDVLAQMAAALQHLHDKGIAHVDVKPDNIFEVEGGEKRYRLGDFGLARALHAMHSSRVVSNEGDSRYLPRELLNDDLSHLDKADMFSLGCTLYELATKCQLPSEGEKYHQLRDGKLALLPAFTRSFQDMLRALMHNDPCKRPSGGAVLASSLITKRTQQDGFAPLSLQRSSLS